MERYRIGVDIGGTFTDAVMMNEVTGELRLAKVSSTPSDPSIGFMNVTQRILREAAVEAFAISYAVHGTTVATNTIIEGKGARTALLATEGFRDVFEIARQIRPRLYDIFCDKPKPLVPRHLCFEASERLDASGSILRPLDEESVRKAACAMRREGVQSVVVCFLHSYRNAIHERRAGVILREELPGVYVSVSSDLCPEMREYFRASTTAVNATVLPVVSRYLEQLEDGLQRIGVTAGLHLMTSSGGIISSPVARREPLHLIESGPAAGVMAATQLGQLVGEKNVISFDMGGTTAKAGLVEGGTPRIAPHFEVGALASSDSFGAGYPVRTPVVDLVEVGAGGGSIAWVDPGGGLRVGPQSGGADPGPACYGLGQSQPCITDANLVLGRIDPNYFLGGEQRLHTELARQAVFRLGEQLGLSMTQTAAGIIEIANANMVAAIRLVSVQRGFDPREFTLVAFGGAGPLHANALAAELGIRRVLIPNSPGVTSALGLLVTDIKHDYLQAWTQHLDRTDFESLNRIFAEFQQRGAEVLAREGVSPDQMWFSRSLDMRYVGQSFELRVSAPGHPLTSEDAPGIASAFFREHERLYGYAATTEPTEIVNVRLTAKGAIRRPAMRRLPEGAPDPSVALKGSRKVWFGELRCTEVYDRYRLRAGTLVHGPAIVEEVDSTTVIHPGYRAQVDIFGNLILEQSQ